jgi:Family of unknown function (DUF6496)
LLAAPALSNAKNSRPIFKHPHEGARLKQRKISAATNLKGVSFMARYGKKASQKVKRAMHKRKRGTLKSGRSGRRVRSRKQAIAIGLSEARRSGGKVPQRKRKRK